MIADVLLIGGGVAAASAAAELRARGFDGSVMLVTRELQAPYHRPPITKDLLTGRCDVESLLVHPEPWWDEQQVELRTRAGVMSLDAEARTAKLASKEEISFGRALLATGAMVRRLNIPGTQLDGLHYLRAPGNAESLRRDVDEAEHVVVVGGSFIACEVAASLTSVGKRCTLVMQERQPLDRTFGDTAGRFVAELLASHGVELLGGEDVVELAGEDRVAEVVTASGSRIAADAVVVGVGAVPDAMLATRAGLEIGETGGIRCDARLRTSAESIYAAGDVCEYESALHGRAVRIEHEEHAAAQGRTAARNMLGEQVDHAVVPYFWTDLADWATIEYVGVAAEWDSEVVSGDPAEGSFTLWHVRADQIVGALAFNRQEDVDTARELVAARAPASRLEPVGGEVA
jgi:3-phenylpropionate/trans-cinnamate dioxygenase ferredoxin reductase subunit